MVRRLVRASDPRPRLVVAAETSLGSPVTAAPAGCAVADWVDEPPSIQCTALKTNGEQCSAHKVSNSPFCVGHIRGWRKQNEKADG